MALTHPDWDERRLTRTIGRGVLALVAVIWSTVTVLRVPSEGGWQPWTLAGGSIVLLLLPAVGSLIRRREAAAVAVGMGVFAASFFHHWAPQVLLAFPMAAAGVLLLWSGGNPGDPRPAKSTNAPKPAPNPEPERGPSYDADPARDPEPTGMISLDTGDDDIRSP